MVKKQASIAKITPPSPKGVFCRKRLFYMLDRYRDKPIIWVTGPPGSGKTTLVSSYLHARKLPCLWYQVDEGDADISTFFYYMGSAAKKASPRKRKPLPLLTPEYQMGISTFAKRYFEELFGRLAKGKSKRGGFIIVFDNYQEVSAESSLHETIQNGLSEIPEGINVILVSRSSPPPVFTRMIANNLMEIIDWEKLRLTPEETIGVMKLHSKKRLSKEAVIQMHEKTKGWVAGLVLLEKAKTEGIESSPIGRWSQEKIFDYFAGEILNKADMNIRKFLLTTSFLPQITLPAAEKLTGLNNAEQILSDLSGKNFFTERHYYTEPAYQYHPLFREFLLSNAMRIFSQQELAAIRLRSAGYLEEAGQIEDAAGLYASAEKWEELIGLILKHATSFFSQGRFRIIGDWLDSIPNDMVEEDPYLLYFKGASLLPFNPLGSLKIFERAYELFRLRNDRTGIFLSWSEIVKSIWHDADDYNLMDRQIASLKDILDENPLFPSAEIEARVTVGMISALPIRQPHHPEISQWEERAFDLLRKGRDPHIFLEVGMPLAIYHIWSGNFEKAAIVLNMLKEKTSGDTPPLVLITIKIPEALYDWLVSASPDSCFQNMSDALRLAEKAGIHIWDHNLFCQVIASALSAGDMERAGEFLQKMTETLNKGKKINTTFYYYLLAWEALLKGDLDLALRNQNMLLSLVDSLGSPFPTALCHHGMAEILIEKGEYNPAMEHLAHALKIGREIKSALVEYMCLLTEAYMYLIRRKGETENRRIGGWEGKGIESLRKAMTLGRERGFINIFGCWRPSVMSELCMKALEAGIEVDYVQGLIRKRNLIPENPLLIENWPWRLKIFTLGKFEILKDGKPFRFSKKVQQRPLDMLKALVAFGGRDVPEEKLADALWPNAEGDLAHKSFEMTLLRLRRLLGDNVLKFQGGLLALDERYCWLDVWAFQRIRDEIEDNNNISKRGHGEKTRMQEIMRLTESALHIYKGHFLPADALKSWSFSKREHLKTMFVQLMIRTGRDWEESGEWKRALECFEKGLEIDNLFEEFYQRLMVCHQRLGQKAEAVKVYKLCRSMLASDLGITPSPKTEEIYSDLIKE